MEFNSADVPCWRSVTGAPRASGEGVHVWRVALDADDQLVAQLARLLDPAEQSQAERFRADELRRRFIMRRARRRQILASYLAAAPAALQFDLNRFGKPSLAPPWNERKLEFSASHSNNWALVAVAFGRTIGVDIEQRRAIPDFEDLCRYYFAPSENSDFAKLPLAERLEVFFRLWVRKEAVLKALGAGLSLGLDQVVVSAEKSRPQVETICGSRDRAAQWALEDLDPAPGFAAAVAWESSDLGPTRASLSIKRYAFPPDGF